MHMLSQTVVLLEDINERQMEDIRKTVLSWGNRDMGPECEPRERDPLTNMIIMDISDTRWDELRGYYGPV